MMATISVNFGLRAHELISVAMRLVTSRMTWPKCR